MLLLIVNTLQNIDIAKGVTISFNMTVRVLLQNQNIHNIFQIGGVLPSTQQPYQMCDIKYVKIELG